MHSVDHYMMEHMCRLGGATVQSEPGPEPVYARRFEEVAFCSTSQFVLVHSWTNGAALMPAQPEPADPTSVTGSVTPQCSSLRTRPPCWCATEGVTFIA